MAVSFFLNVAVGAGLGPTMVALASAHIFGAQAGLGAPIALTATLGYGFNAAALIAAWVWIRPTRTDLERGQRANDPSKGSDDDLDL